MSTYTDLKNTIKETVVVNYTDRATSQEVKFLNENNEYWGTFKGTTTLDSSEIVNSTLKNVKIIGADLEDANIGPINLAIDDTDLYTFKFGTASRSCYRNILEDFERQNAKLSNDFLGHNHYDVFGKAPPFEPEEVNSLRSILADGFTKYGITPQIADTPS
jgi:hypothetical protein